MNFIGVKCCLCGCVLLGNDEVKELVKLWVISFSCLEVDWVS